MFVVRGGEMGAGSRYPIVGAMWDRLFESIVKASSLPASILEITVTRGLWFIVFGRAGVSGLRLFWI